MRLIKLYGEKFGTENVKIIQDSDKVTYALHFEIIICQFQVWYFPSDFFPFLAGDGEAWEIEPFQIVKERTGIWSRIEGYRSPFSAPGQLCDHGEVT